MTGTGQKRRMNATKQADKLFSEIVRERGGCWAKGRDEVECNGNLQCAHIISRRYRAIRWDRANAVPLCAAHHVFYTHRPLEWRELHGEAWNDLTEMALGGTPESAADAVVRLRSIRGGK